MAHTFDHGLAKPLRTLVREGVIARLGRLLISAGGYLSAIIPVGSVVRGTEDVDGISYMFDALNGRAPAIAVAIGDETFTPAGMSGYQWRSTLDVRVYAITNNLRSREARQAADVVALASNAKDPGIDILLEHLAQLLIGYQIASSSSPKGQQIFELRPTRQQELVNNNAMALWEAVFTVDLSREINAKRDVNTAITSLWTFTKIDTKTVVETHQEIP